MVIGDGGPLSAAGQLPIAMLGVCGQIRLDIIERMIEVFDNIF